MLLTILAVHTRAAVVRAAVSRGVAVAVAVGVLTWEEEKLPPLLLIGFCIHSFKILEPMPIEGRILKYS